jgi:hypothetical protein
MHLLLSFFIFWNNLLGLIPFCELHFPTCDLELYYSYIMSELVAYLVLYVDTAHCSH